jgi:hypothetical protein
MKLRKQAPAKAIVLAATLGLLAAFFGLIRSEPRIKAESVPPPGQPGVDYDRFFAPAAGSAPRSTSPTHTRTHAS